MADARTPQEQPPEATGPPPTHPTCSTLWFTQPGLYSPPGLPGHPGPAETEGAEWTFHSDSLTSHSIGDRRRLGLAPQPQRPHTRTCLSPVTLGGPPAPSGLDPSPHEEAAPGALPSPHTGKYAISPNPSATLADATCTSQVLCCQPGPRHHLPSPPPPLSPTVCSQPSSPPAP